MNYQKNKYIVRIKYKTINKNSSTSIFFWLIILNDKQILKFKENNSYIT